METKKEFYLRHIKAVNKMKPKEKLSVRKYAETERDLEKYKKMLLSSKKTGIFFNIDYEKEALKEAFSNASNYFKENCKLIIRAEGEESIFKAHYLQAFCSNCGALFSRENAKFPVYKEKKKTGYYICSECKFRS